MTINNEDKVYCINTLAELENLKSLYKIEVDKRIDKSFEISAVQRMYEYKFKQSSDLKSLRLKLNPYLIFFENQITDPNLSLNNGLCVMYPATLITEKIEGHVKFVGNLGVLLYMLVNQNEDSYTVDELISIFAATGKKHHTEIAIKKIERIIELLITDLLLIIE